jgi:uncharacterized protein
MVSWKAILIACSRYRSGMMNDLTERQKVNNSSLIAQLKKTALEYIQVHSYAGHDQNHTIRVYELSRIIGEKEGADPLILEAAALLHDVGRGFEGVDHAEKSAEIAEKLLSECSFPVDKIPQVLYAIKMHRYSRGEEPTTLEAKLLQDADRIDASGAVGVAMTFAYGGSKNAELYSRDDPLAMNRKLDDTRYVLDHFQTKLFKLPETMHTKTAQQLIRKRASYLKSFFNQFLKEIGAETKDAKTSPGKTNR